MNYSILDKLNVSAALRAEMKESAIKSTEELRAKLENYYKFDVLPRFGITKEQAIKINMGDKETINAVYFANVRYFTSLSIYMERYESHGTTRYLAEDTVNQIYIDMRYYDYSSVKTFKRGVFTTCRNINTGGILSAGNSNGASKKCAHFLYDEIKAHNSKMEDGKTLLDYISETMTAKDDPESLLIRQEDGDNEQYAEIMLHQILNKLPPKQRNKFAEAFGLGNG